MPTYMQKFREVGHSPKVITKNCAGMIETAVGISRTDYEQELKHLTQNEPLTIIREDNFRLKIELVIQSDGEYVYSLMYSPSTTKRMFERLLR